MLNALVFNLHTALALSIFTLANFSRLRWDSKTFSHLRACTRPCFMHVVQTRENIFNVPDVKNPKASQAIIKSNPNYLNYFTSSFFKLKKKSSNTYYFLGNHMHPKRRRIHVVVTYVQTKSTCIAILTAKVILRQKKRYWYSWPSPLVTIFC